MTGIRISTRTELKNGVLSLYNDISENNEQQAIRSLESVRKNTIIYYNTRGINCSNFFPIFSEIHNLLKKNFLSIPGKRNLVKERLYHYMFKLNKEMKFGVTGDENTIYSSKNIIVLLRNLSDDLIDDYSEFNLMGGQEDVERNRKVLDLIKNDLLEIRELEPLVKNESKELIEKYNALVKMANLCLLILPQVKDVTVSAATAKTFRTYFEQLFTIFADIFIPVETKREIEKEYDGKAIPSIQMLIESKKEPKKKETVKPKKEEAKEPEKSEKTDDEEEVVDLEELERRAIEGSLDEPNT